MNALNILKLHRTNFYASAEYATLTKQPVPCDTRAWSQILISSLTGIEGLDRKKGPDLIDGSDVKAANMWLAIDRPRFNSCIRANSKECLDKMPYLFFVLWDQLDNNDRCRVWVVRPQHDKTFREVCLNWYAKKKNGEIRSDNFQLHPRKNNVFNNKCGNLKYPLLFDALWQENEYKVMMHQPEVLKHGESTFS